MKHTFTLLLSLLICAVAAAQEKTITKSFSGVKTIRLNTASGDINIRKSAGSDVKLVLRHSYDDDRYKPVIEQDGSRLTLKEEFERGSSSGSATWNLELPDNMDINVNTGSGDITVEKLALEIKSNTGSGDIELTDVNGELDFNTGSGDIEMETVGGEVRMNTGSGDVRATNGSGSYAINAGSGDIRLNQLKGDFDINTGSGAVDARALQLNGSSAFNTGSGDATVALGAPLNHSIRVNSGSGDATLNFNGNEISGEVIMTCNKRNGDIVAPFKFDKEETIDDEGSNPRLRKTARLGSKDIQIKVGTGSGTAEISK